MNFSYFCKKLPYNHNQISMSTISPTLLDQAIELEGLLSLLISGKCESEPRALELAKNKAEIIWQSLSEVAKCLPPNELPPDIPEMTSVLKESIKTIDTTESNISVPTIPIPEIPAIGPVETQEETDTDDEEIAENAEREEFEDAEPDAQPIVEGDSASDGIEQTGEFLTDEHPAPKPRNAKIKFSVNDRFRFRRELFNFSDEEMTDALNVIESMSTVDEINEYFYNDLCWDPENADVADFMAIVTTHINNRDKCQENYI
ncbi:MAG: hypothetical protein NC230_06090 [Bacteroides sp.]|nr:hypothetical protein [Bacteroides sp.]